MQHKSHKNGLTTDAQLVSLIMNISFHPLSLKQPYQYYAKSALISKQ